MTIRERLGHIVKGAKTIARKIVTWPDWMVPGSGMGAAFGQWALMACTSPFTVPTAAIFYLPARLLQPFAQMPAPRQTPTEEGLTRYYWGSDPREWVQFLGRLERPLQAIFSLCYLFGTLPIMLPGTWTPWLWIKLALCIPFSLIGFTVGMVFLVSLAVLRYVLEWRHDSYE